MPLRSCERAPERRSSLEWLSSTDRGCLIERIQNHWFLEKEWPLGAGMQWHLSTAEQAGSEEKMFSKRRCMAIPFKEAWCVTDMGGGQKRGSMKAEVGHGKTNRCNTHNAEMRGKKHRKISKEFYQLQPKNSWSWYKGIKALAAEV